MLLRSRDRRWLSSDVQSDLVLVCTDGQVSAHSAFLAGSSPMLSRLLSQPSSRLCGGCQAPRSLILAGVAVTECRALVDLLYTGKAQNLHTHLDSVKELGLVLGLDLDRLEMVTRGSVSHRLSSDGPDGIHYRFNKSNVKLSGDQEKKLVKLNTNSNTRTDRTSVIPTKLKQLFHSSLISKQQNANEDTGESSSSSNPLSDSVAEPLSKLPVRTPPLTDNILQEQEDRDQVKVVVPNAVLSEVMEMMPVENIKMETEDTQDFPQMEGREEDEEDVNSSVTSYLSMNNPRNYVCDRCDASFTFQRSYKKHREEQCKVLAKKDTSPAGGSKPKPKLKTASNEETQVNVPRRNKIVANGPRRQVESPIVKEKVRNSLYKASQLKRRLQGAPAGVSPVKKPITSFQTVRLKPAGGGGGGGRKVACGRCVKCRLPDCGTCPPCTGGGDPSLPRLCVKKACRNKLWLPN